MSVKTNLDLALLDYVIEGAPYVKSSSKNAFTDPLEYVFQGGPYTKLQPRGAVSPTPGSIDPAYNTVVYIKVGGTWKEIDKLHGNIAVNVGSGTWRYGDTLGVRVGDYWRTNET